MALNSLYTSNTIPYYLTNESGNFATFMGSQKLENLYTGGETFDNSCYYTMCIDNECNKIYKVTYESAKDNFKVNTKTIIGDHNGIVNLLRNTSNTSTGILKGNERLQINNGVALRSPYGINNQFDMSTHYIQPWIYVFDKSDCDETAFYTQSVYDNSKIKKITLQELYNNKDKYYVTSFITEMRVWLTNNYSYYANNPVRIVKYGENYIGRSPATYNGNNIFIPSSGVPEINGFWRRYTSSAISGGDWNLNFCNTDITDNTDSIMFCDYGNIDITFSFDRQFELKKTSTGLWHFKSWTDTNGSQYKSGIFTYDTEYVLRCFAESGLYIAWTDTRPTKPIANSGNVAIGEMNENGFTTGKIIPPSQLDDYNGKNKTLTDAYSLDIDPNNYKPVIPDVKTTEPSQFGNYECKSGGVRYYGMTSTQYFAFNQWINGDLDSGYEPMQSIVYFAYQPFKSNTTFMPDMDNVKIGGKSSVQMKPLNKSTSIYYLGSYNVIRIHNNFLDFSPYTDITVYIPLCGEISIPTNIVMGNTIKTYLITDTQTGGCTGYVTAIVNGSEILIGQRTGQFVQNMPLSSQEVGMRKQAETNALMSVGASTVATGLGIATGNPMAVIGGIGGLIASTVNGLIASNTNRTQSTGSISDVINFNMPVQCYIRISSPDTSIPDNYGHTVGYMTNKTKTIAECNGYTVCNNVDVSGLSCTETEKQMIKSALENGCYL